MDINSTWDKFFNLACRDLDQSFKITDKFEISKYMMGICTKPIIENTYFVGNCFGSLTPGLGFGQFTSMLTGIYSAYDLCGLGKYTELVKPLFENYNNSLTLRRFLEGLNDDKLDLIIKNLDNKLTEGITDKIFSNTSEIDLLKLLSPSMKAFNYIDSK